jgi:hypothetical protein
MIEEPTDGARIGSEYFPRSITANDKCAVWSGPKGLQYITTDGTQSAVITTTATGAPILGTRIAGTTVELVIRAPASEGGGVYTAPLPGPCL